MTQPYGGQWPDDPESPPGQPYGQPPYPPATDPFSIPPATGPFSAPTSEYPQQGHPQPGQGPGGYPATAQPFAPSGRPTQAPGQHLAPAGPPDAGPGAPAPDTPLEAPGRRLPHRNVIVGAVLAVVLVLCVGGGISAWLLTSGLEGGDGAADPATAVTGFLKAVYTEKDADQAEGLVCAEARDKPALKGKVAEVKSYESRYESPRFSWDDPKVVSRGKEKAVVTATLTMTTADEKTAQQKLTFTVVQKSGWWVCDVA